MTEITPDGLTGSVETKQERYLNLEATYGQNVSSTPEQFGFERIGEVDWEDESYSFDFTVILRDLDTGAFYTADDSGCSCPSPFENVGRRDTAGPFTAHEVIAAITERLNSEQERVVSYGYVDRRDVDPHVRESAMNMIEKMARIR